MTLVNIDKVNDVIVVSASGHAGYSSENDIVCAAISTVTQCFLQTIEYYESQYDCSILSKKINESAGCCLFSFKCYNTKVIDTVVKMAIIGYKMIQASYGDYISVNVNI